jgi:signal transduction histidine kinase
VSPESYLSDEDKLFIDTERLRAVAQQASLTLGVTIINAALTAIVLGPLVSPVWLWSWVAALAGVSAARWIIRQYLVVPTLETGRPGRLGIITTLSSVATGILWGAGVLLLSPGNELYELFFAFVIAGMCAGTTAVNSAYMPVVLAFILPATLPLAMRFLIGGSSTWLVSGLMTLLFTAALCVTSFRVHRDFGTRVRLQLLLDRRGRALRDANERLRGEHVERLKAEATLHQAQKMEAIGHLTGGIAHDFNNLLQVVTANLGMIGNLARGNDRLLNYVSRAEQAIDQSARLTASLLAFARRQAFSAERINVNTVLRDFEPILLGAINSQVRLTIVPAPNLPDCEVDISQFQAAVLNIVINARDAMPSGGTLTITTAETVLSSNDLLGNPDAVSGQFVSIAVQDTGTGMHPDVLARVFEPFFTTKDVGKGSGLGLSQVYGFARQSAGHVTVRTTPGSGTCVTILLPAHAPTANPR